MIVRPHETNARALPNQAFNCESAITSQQRKSRASNDNVWGRINRAALDDLGRWWPALFPKGYRSGTSWRAGLTDRGLEEDIAATHKGIKDFGVHDLGDPRKGKRSPIELVVEHGGTANHAQAAHWLCDRLGIDPTSLGWVGPAEHLPQLRRTPASPSHTPIHLSTLEATDLTDEERIAFALEVFDQAGKAAGTRAELYLHNRRLTLPENAHAVIRYHPRCPFGAGKQTPCLVALIRSVTTDEPQGILRIAITADGYKSHGEKKSKRTLGVVKGGAVKLTADADVSLALGIAEGLETALSMRRCPEFGETPAWALLGTGGLSELPALGGIETLWIALDNDPAGERAAAAVASRWRDAGREVLLIHPRADGADLNTLVSKRAAQ